MQPSSLKRSFVCHKAFRWIRLAPVLVGILKITGKRRTSYYMERLFYELFPVQ